jgi:hypothetical protein
MGGEQQSWMICGSLAREFYRARRDVRGAARGARERRCRPTISDQEMRSAHALHSEPASPCTTKPTPWPSRGPGA